MHRITMGMALAIGLSTAACTSPGSSQADSLDRDRQLALVNDEPIMESEFRVYLEVARGELSEDPGPTPDRELFREFVIRKLLLQEARRQGVTVGEDQVQHYVEAWVPRGSSVDPRFPDQVYDMLVVQQLLKERAISKAPVTQRELQAYFNEHQQDFQVEDQVHVLEILTEDMNSAVRIREQLTDGDFSRFREAARLYSVGVMAESGGDLGIFQRGELPEEFERILFSLRPGQISEPHQSSHGFHLFMVEERTPKRHQRFHEVREEVFRALATAREREGIDKYVKQMIRGARISVLDPDLAFDEVSRNAVP